MAEMKNYAFCNSYFVLLYGHFKILKATSHRLLPFGRVYGRCFNQTILRIIRRLGPVGGGVRETRQSDYSGYTAFT
jgi:hypothetical protein